MNSFFQEVCNSHLSNQPKIASYLKVSGGCINQAAKISTDYGNYFIKWSAGTDHFEIEVKGLKLLQENASLRVPDVLGFGTINKHSYLLLEWMDQGKPQPSSWQTLGRSLAQMHQVTNKQFGLDHDNLIGRLHQSNRMRPNWSEFFIQERLMPQIKLSEAKGLINNELIKRFDALFMKLHDLVPEEKPALLHGDLWSGNFLFDTNGLPVLFDPAVHFGHRETEIAFTQLFGGFDDRFYDTYNESFPLDAGFENRADIHNLYPLLVHVNLFGVHVNLFGSSYLQGIVSTLKKLT